MIGQKLFDELSAKLGETIANSPAKDVEKNIKTLMSASFTKMDLVTRSEFDIQQQVLLKTRAQLAALESRLAALESQLAPAATEAEQPEA